MKHILNSKENFFSPHGEELRNPDYHKIVLDAMQEMVAYLDRDLRVKWANKAAAEPCGQPPEKIAGHHCFELWQQRQTPCSGCPVLRAMDTGRVEEGEVDTPDGRIYQIRAYPVLDARGRIIGAAEFALDITESKQALSALRESEQGFRNLVEASPMSIFMIQQGRYIFGNKAGARLMGYESPDEIMGMNALEPIAPEYHWMVMERMGNLESGGENAPVQLRLIRPDGTSVWALSASVKVPIKGMPTVVVVGQDITEQKLVESELRVSEQKFSTIFHHTPALISISCLDRGTYLDINDTFVQVTGYSRKMAMGKTSVELGFISPEDRNQLRQKLIETGSVKDLELNLNKADGSAMICLYSGEVLELGGVKRLLSMAVDITDRKNQERLVRQKQADLEKMNTALHVVIDYSRREKIRVKEELFKDFENLVFPYFPCFGAQATRQELSTAMSILEKNIKDVLLCKENRYPDAYRKLTPVESKIALLIREGKPSKDISLALNISLRMVYFHRERIRKKLGLDHKNKNLKTYLQSITR